MNYCLEIKSVLIVFCYKFRTLFIYGNSNAWHECIDKMTVKKKKFVLAI